MVAPYYAQSCDERYGIATRNHERGKWLLIGRFLELPLGTPALLRAGLPAPPATTGSFGQFALYPSREAAEEAIALLVLTEAARA